MCILYIYIYIYSEFSTGLNLDFVCRLELDHAVDSELIVTSFWTKDSIPVTTDSPRLTVTEPVRVQESPQVFESVIMFRTLDDRVDSGTYNCSLVIQAANNTFIAGTTTSVSMELTVEGVSF